MHDILIIAAVHNCFLSAQPTRHHLIREVYHSS